MRTWGGKTYTTFDTKANARITNPQPTNQIHRRLVTGPKVAPFGTVHLALKQLHTGCERDEFELQKKWMSIDIRFSSLSSKLWISGEMNKESLRKISTYEEKKGKKHHLPVPGYK